MSKVILHVAQTIDGYISRPDGRVDYLGVMGNDMIEKFQIFISRIDVVVIGRNTYELYKQFGFQMYGDRPIYVWTNSISEPINNIQFYTKSIKELLVEIGEKTVWCFGGDKTIHEFLNNDLVDILEIATVPYLLGNGKRLFEIGEFEQSWVHKETKVDSGTVMTTYTKKER